MPELPEVETVRRGLAPHVVDQPVHWLRISDPRLTLPDGPGGVEDAVAGRVVTALERRGKYLVWRFEDDLTLLWHLRMTGSFQAEHREIRPDRLRAVMHVGGSWIGYRDPRRFGTLHAFSDAGAEAYLDARLGPEPLGNAFSALTLQTSLQRRSAPIKAVLLDQRTVAGLGNIYVDEALFLARIHPLRSANRVSAAAAGRLHTAIVERLVEAIAAQGSTLRDYRTVSGESGGMQERFFVYGREGEPCRVCQTPIQRMVVAGRGTWFCRRCQPRRR